jgi:hypothetical protein
MLAVSISDFDPHRTRGSFRLRTCELDHVGPFLGFVPKSLASLDRACRNHRPGVSAMFSTFAFDDIGLPWLGINT